MMRNHRFVLVLSLLLVVAVGFWGCSEEPNLTSPNSTTGVNPAGQANFAQTGSGLFLTAPPLSGAIFTTLVDGARVNANLYEAKEDVYLDGGPPQNAPASAAGLPGLMEWLALDAC